MTNRFQERLRILKEGKDVPFDKPYKDVQRTPEKDASRARQLAVKAEKKAKKSWKRRQVKEEQLDELRKSKDPDKGRKYISGGARAAEGAAFDKYYKKYDDETAARRKALKDKTPESKEKAEKAGEDRKHAAKRVMKLQKIKEENVNEVLDTDKKKEEYMEKANKSFTSSFGKKDPKSAHTVSKRLEGLRMMIRKKK